MSNKYLHYAELSETHSKHVIDSASNWTGLLTTAARMYKYSFDEQLLIHAQKPHATACAEFDTWKRPEVGRYVKRGSKGIALLDDTGSRQKLRYVFDVSDTGNGRRSPKNLYVWQMKPEHESLVVEALGRPLGEIPAIAAELAQEYLEDNNSDILDILEQAGFTDYDAFVETLVDSTAYMIMSRCGMDTSAYTGGDKFQHISLFDNSRVLKALGEAASTVSEDVLRDIEAPIKRHDREQARLAQIERSNFYDGELNESTSTSSRNNLQPSGGLSDSRHHYPGGREQSTRLDNVGNDAERLPTEAPQNHLHRLEDGGKTVPSLFGNRGTSDRAHGVDDGAVVSEESRIGGLETNRPDSVGTGNERLESPSGGSHQDGDNLQLSTEQPEMPPTGGIFAGSSIDPTMNIITDDETNAVLKGGSGIEHGKFRIFSYFLQEHDAGERARFLRDEYGWGGRGGNAIPGVDKSNESHDGKGIKITKGNSLEPSSEVRLTWANVAQRIDNLIKNGDYMSQDEIDRLPSYERQILGAEVSRFYDYTDTPPPIPILRTGDFWGEARRIGDLLDNPDIRAEILLSMVDVMQETPADHRSYNSRRETLDNLKAFNKGEFMLFPNHELAIQPSLLRDVNEAEAADTSKIVNTLHDSNTTIPHTRQRHRTATHDDQQLTLHSMFLSEEAQKAYIKETEEKEEASQPVVINQEDIDTALAAWNGDIESKIRANDFMSRAENARSLDAAAILMLEFGGDSEGLTVNKDNADPLVVPWDKVQQRISFLVDAGHFLTPDELDYVQEMERREAKQRTITMDLAEQGGEPSGLPITHAIAETFRNPNDNRNDFLFARNESGEIFISNRYFIMKPVEQDIEKITEQLNQYRNTDRRRKELPPLTATENDTILEHLNVEGDLHQ
ncbi:MAG: hypothetical protein FWF79_01300, partial [Defluviitaleaceae bacterium]|nr:hypothetical protein [Defluviitaleaceae bacterium]